MYPESLIPAGVDCNPSKTCFLTPKLFIIGFGLELEAEVGTNVEDIPELLEDFLTSSEVVGEVIAVLVMEAKTEDNSNG